MKQCMHCTCDLFLKLLLICTADFLCKDRRRCVLKKLVCDGRAHCHDSSDEVDCPTIAPPASRVKVSKCRVGFWLCLDQTQCVSFSHVCDGEKDCQDGSDEEECGMLKF